MASQLPRWDTEFAKWINQYGVPALVTDLGRSGHPVTSKAVYHWIAGRHAPRPQHAAAIATLSQGQIGVEQIYRHQEQVGLPAPPLVGLGRTVSGTGR